MSTLFAVPAFVMSGRYDGAPRFPCGEVDPELFFPEDRHDASHAKAICQTCPARADCREYAISDPSVRGIWGGTADRERQHQRPRRKA